MVKLVDALASGASRGNPVEVQVLSSAPHIIFMWPPYLKDPQAFSLAGFFMSYLSELAIKESSVGIPAVFVCFIWKINCMENLQWAFMRSATHTKSVLRHCWIDGRFTGLIHSICIDVYLIWKWITISSIKDDIQPLWKYWEKPYFQAGIWTDLSFPSKFA